MVWCSGRDQGGAGGAHPSFKLKQTPNEWVVLSDANGNLVDDFQWLDNTKTDHSLGRTTDGAATWDLFTNPTPNGSNAGASLAYTPRPQLSPAAGFFAGAQSVTLTCADPAATIYYTLNGDEPTAASTACRRWSARAGRPSACAAARRPSCCCPRAPRGSPCAASRATACSARRRRSRRASPDAR